MERSARMRELSGCLLAAKVMRLVVALAAYLFAGVSYAAIAESSAVVTLVGGVSRNQRNLPVLSSRRRFIQSGPIDCIQYCTDRFSAAILRFINPQQQC